MSDAGATPLAEEALKYFSDFHISESRWRCEAVLKTKGGREALLDLRNRWPAEVWQGYLSRPDIQALKPEAMLAG